jgi:hypothetical protein
MKFCAANSIWLAGSCAMIRIGEANKARVARQAMKMREMDFMM